MKLELVIQNAYKILKKNNIKSAFLDSEILLSTALNKTREYIILNPNFDISGEEYNNFQKMVY